MTSRRVVHIVNLLLLSALLGGCLLVFDQLPERIPRHFGWTGEADAYWEATRLHWMLLPLIALFVVSVLYGAAWLVGKSGTVSIPDQARFDALSEAGKREVVGAVMQYLYWIAAGVAALFAVIQLGILQVARGLGARMPGYVLVAEGAFFLLVAAGTVWLYHYVRRRVDELSDPSA